MKKVILIIFMIILIVGIAIITRPYTKKDVQRVLDIVLGKKQSNILDYARLDINKDNEIDLYDGILILNKIGENNE